ncbi:MAG: efflux RND transporter permease subunit [Gammaproteobacteria bacterium]|nr:efflux RND transporter permease subunit [Gammaproteobacteria bacterium]
MACIYFAGFTLNIISLLALVLAIGLVVDDAIVMVENIARHIEEGLSPMAAAFKGSREVLFAILAMTLTLAAVYAPIGFSQGFTGQLFWQFAFTLTMAVIISGVVAVTLSPMMCAYLLPKKQASRGWVKWCDNAFDRLIAGYQRQLANALNHRLWIVILLLLLLIGGYFLLKNLPSMLAPTSDQGTITLPIDGPSNASFDYMKQQAQKIDKILATVEQGEQRLITIGEPIVPKGHANLILKPWGKRKANQQQISQALNKKLSQLPGVNIFAASPPPLGINGQGDFDIELVLMGSDGYRPLNQVAHKLITALSSYPGLKDIQTNLTWDKLQYDVEVNRDIAADLGIPVSDITTAFSTMLGSYTISDGYFYQGSNYDIILQGVHHAKSLEQQLQNIYVRTASDEMVPISTLITINQSALSSLKCDNPTQFSSACFSKIFSR